MCTKRCFVVLEQLLFPNNNKTFLKHKKLLFQNNHNQASQHTLFGTKKIGVLEHKFWCFGTLCLEPFTNKLTRYKHLAVIVPKEYFFVVSIQQCFCSKLTKKCSKTLEIPLFQNTRAIWHKQFFVPKQYIFSPKQHFTVRNQYSWVSVVSP